MAYYRPLFRQQKPSVDPKEPWPGESAARGSDHGWNNCSMTSGAMALDYHTRGRVRLWGGDLRHHQSDLVGGTDLNDLKVAWSHIGTGYTLLNWSGRGWDAVIAAHEAGRAVMIQGTGDTPGRGIYKGPHACIWCPDNAWGDPLASRWQRVAAGSALDRASIRRWAERLNPRIQFAVTRARAG